MIVDLADIGRNLYDHGRGFYCLPSSRKIEGELGGGYQNVAAAVKIWSHVAWPTF